MIIPILIVLGAVSGGTWQLTGSHSTMTYGSAAAGGLLFFGPLLMILFRQKYPRWWVDWNLELQRFGNRVGTYLALMNDSYPSTDDHQWVELDYAYPDAAADLNRWLPLVKWLLAIPHYIVLFFLDIAAFFAVIVTWFAILFTGRYPRGIFSFVEGVSAGTTASSPTRSPWPPTGTRRSGWRRDPAPQAARLGCGRSGAIGGSCGTYVARRWSAGRSRHRRRLVIWAVTSGFRWSGRRESNPHDQLGRSSRAVPQPAPNLAGPD